MGLSHYLLATSFGLFVWYGAASEAVVHARTAEIFRFESGSGARSCHGFLNGVVISASPEILLHPPE